MDYSNLSVIILAAGKGTRMKSDLPKVLHEVNGQTMVEGPVKAALSLGADVRVVVGYCADQVRKKLSGYKVGFYNQEQQLGTAHAVKVAMDDDIKEWLITINGDHPLTDSQGLRDIVDECRRGGYDVCATAIEVDPDSKFGRIIRDDNGDFLKIVEYADASEQQRQITEASPNIFVARSAVFAEAMSKISTDNAQGEYYLPDLATTARSLGYKVGVVKIPAYMGVGVNTPEDREYAEKLAAEQQQG